MLFLTIVSLFVIGPSLWLMRAIERDAELLGGGPLRLWRRILIPLPIICFLAANLDGVLSFGSYLEMHPRIDAARYAECQAWNADRFFYAGLLALALQPFILAPAPLRGFDLLFVTWGGHALWVFFPFCPLLLASGVPLRD